MNVYTGEGHKSVDMLRVDSSGSSSQGDQVAIEEPLEIRVEGAEPVITMRTPGHDAELVAGLLLSEGLVSTSEDFELLSPRLDRDGVFQVRLRSFSEVAAGLMQRSSLSNSACGVCGKKKLNLELMESLAETWPAAALSKHLLWELPRRLREHQQVFHATGGLHAAALFDQKGTLLVVREDVGRHNALDKLNGWALLNGYLPLDRHIVMLSGRASFELVQKCVMARVPVVCAISAPSSFAVKLAAQYGVTLVGFLRDKRFNVYTHPKRLTGLSVLYEVDSGRLWGEDHPSSFTTSQPR